MCMFDFGAASECLDFGLSRPNALFHTNLYAIRQGKYFAEISAHIIGSELVSYWE